VSKKLCRSYEWMYSRTVFSTHCVELLVVRLQPETMRLMREHLFLTTWLLWLQAWRDAGAQTVCPRGESHCMVNADDTGIRLMTCSGYGDLAQLPPACRDDRVISKVVINHRTTVSRLQHRILDGLRIRQLELIGLGIRSITESAFEAISRDLQVLYLHDNQLESLPSGVFRTMLRLGQLQLHNNRLTQLSDGTFSGLVNLVYLTLNVNRLSRVDPSTWRALPDLRVLILEDNRFGNGRLVFPAGAMPNLEELRLDKNALTSISEDIISGLPNLRRLHFRWNNVESLPPNVFRAVPRLEMVDLSVNNITELRQDIFNGKYMGSLKRTGWWQNMGVVGGRRDAGASPTAFSTQNLEMKLRLWVRPCRKKSGYGYVLKQTVSK